MRHNREEVTERTIREFELLDHLVASLSNEDWKQPLLRPEAKDPWTAKDALAHITHWKTDVIRSIKGQRRPPEERRIQENDANLIIYMRDTSGCLRRLSLNRCMISNLVISRLLIVSCLSILCPFQKGH